MNDDNENWACRAEARRLPSDVLLLGVNSEELRQLDAATKQAEVHLKAMVKALDANAKSHRAFMAELGKLRAATGAAK